MANPERTAAHACVEGNGATNHFKGSTRSLVRVPNEDVERGPDREKPARRGGAQC